MLSTERLYVPQEKHCGSSLTQVVMLLTCVRVVSASNLVRAFLCVSSAPPVLRTESFFSLS